VITYARESFDVVLVDIQPLWLAHYEEIAWKQDKIKLEVDFDKYRKLEKGGVLRIYTAREDGVLIGYAFFILSQNLHYKSLKQAQNDICYVCPAKRGANVGKHLLRDFAETELRAEGVKVINLHIKTSYNWQKLAERWGYEHTEVNMQKWIGD
jgi:GNAT superfamily N-acetyltransferase